MKESLQIKRREEINKKVIKVQIMKNALRGRQKAIENNIILIIYYI